MAALLLSGCTKDQAPTDTETDPAPEEAIEEGIVQTPADLELEAPDTAPIDQDLTDKWLKDNAEFLAAQPTLGDPDAPVTLVEFADYNCPYCKAFHEETYPWLKSELIETGKVKLVFVNAAFMGEGSSYGAKAGESVYKQSPEAFWVFHDALMTHKGTLESVKDMKAFVKETAKGLIGVDPKKLLKDTETQWSKRLVAEDWDFAMTNGVVATPTILLNGYLFEEANDKMLITQFVEETLQQENPSTPSKETAAEADGGAATDEEEK